MYSVTSNVIALQQLVSYAAAIALVALLWVAYRRLQVTGFLIVALGCGLRLVTNVTQANMSPFRMGKMPFSHARALDDLSRATEFILVTSSHILASSLIVIGAIMVIRTFRRQSQA